MRSNLSIGLLTDTCGSIPQRNNPSNGGISQQNIFSYSYRNDGMPKTQQVTWLNSFQKSFVWTYSLNERELTEQDLLYGDHPVGMPPGGGGNTTIGQKQYSYDQYGRVSQLTFPEGFQLSNYAYDVDDELTAYNVGGQNGVTRNLILNARGELLQDTFNSSLFGYAQGWAQSANGAIVGNGNNEPGEPVNVQAPPTTLQFDVRSNMVKCSTNPQWAQGYTNNWTYNYDAAGRQEGVPVDTSGGCNPQSGLGARTFDAENHLQSTADTQDLMLGGPNPAGTNGCVVYGPDARYRIDQFNNPCSGQANTVHWDGGNLLFVAGSYYAQLYIGKLGLMDASGNIMITDRDQTGTQLAYHAYTSTAPPGGGHDWFPGLSLGSVRNVYISKNHQQIPIQLSVGSCNYTYNNTTYNCPLFYPTYPMTRSDGYQMVGGLVQGVRTYDPTSGQWLTPDAYAGDAHDPMTQKPFMWNGNNPVEFQDPSGYTTVAIYDSTAQTLRVVGVTNTKDAGIDKTFAAGNNTTNPSGDPMKVGSNGPMPSGEWQLGPMEGVSRSEQTSYGNVGFIPLTDDIVGQNGRGLGIHSGRGDNTQHVTNGCIRTTDAAMKFLKEHIPVLLEVNPVKSGNGHPADVQPRRTASSTNSP
jgi:hypothetical protein